MQFFKSKNLFINVFLDDLCEILEIDLNNLYKLTHLNYKKMWSLKEEKYENIIKTINKLFFLCNKYIFLNKNISFEKREKVKELLAKTISSSLDLIKDQSIETIFAIRDEKNS